MSRDADGNGIHFRKACIPLNSRSGLENTHYSVNENGIPCCPNDPSLSMKHEGTSKRKNGIVRYKFICPKVKWERNPSTGKYHRLCHCDTPCTSSPCGRMAYLYPEKDLRTYPSIVRGTKEWNDTYKIRTTVERSINHFKDSVGIAARKMQNEKTLYADLILAGITQLIGVLLADKIEQHPYIRSLKPLVVWILRFLKWVFPFPSISAPISCSIPTYIIIRYAFPFPSIPDILKFHVSALSVLIFRTSFAITYFNIVVQYNSDTVDTSITTLL